MTEEVNVGMGSPVPKKGMSKGCLVTLIVAGVLIALMVALFFVCMSKKEDLVKFGVKTLLTSSKQIVVESDLVGIDTAYYNSVVDNFNTRLTNDTISLEEIANIFTSVQLSLEDKKMDSAEVADVLEALINQYPDIAPDLPDTEIIDSLITQ